MAWAGSMNAPGPFNFRGCDLTAECLPATEEVRAQFPAAAPIFFRSAHGLLLGGLPKTFSDKSRTSCAAESPKLSLPGAAPGRLAIFIGAVAEK